ncbi:hypothetical protein ACU8KH_05463 [Lachancea thermotolerans]
MKLPSPGEHPLEEAQNLASQKSEGCWIFHVYACETGGLATGERRCIELVSYMPWNTENLHGPECCHDNYAGA